MTQQPNRMRSRRARQTQPEQWEAETRQEELSSCQMLEQRDLSAYYSRRRSAEAEDTEPAFAPPPKLEQMMPAEKETPVWEQGNVYRPRQISWEDELPDQENGMEGYQVQDDKLSAAPKRKKKNVHPVRTVLMVVCFAAVILSVVSIVWKPMTELVKENTKPTEAVFSAVTPQPVKAYDEAPAAEIAPGTRNAISELSGTVEMETYIVTDSHVVTRNLRDNGSYDFYLFTAREGRLLCYFEGLNALDMLPLQDGGFYVKQSPWLVAPNGSAMIRTADVEAYIGEKIVLHPLYRGWSVMEAADEFNYISPSGDVLSMLWFSRAYPFTGSHTMAYVDTGSMAEQRYLLYVIGEDGTMLRWMAADDMTDAVVSACGMAYMKNGDLYRLPDIDAPVLNTQELHLYLDCDAMVARDAVSGKYGLFVHGEQHYDFVYDSIHPVESDIPWETKKLAGENGLCTLYAVKADAYPLPLSHSFVLEKDGQREYVALSTESSFPVLLDGEF